MLKSLCSFVLALAPLVGVAAPVTVSGSATVFLSAELVNFGPYYDYVDRPLDIGQRLNFALTYDPSQGVVVSSPALVRGRSVNGCGYVVNGVCGSSPLVQPDVVSGAFLEGKQVLPPRLSSIPPVHVSEVIKGRSYQLEYFEVFTRHFQSVTTGDMETGDFLYRYVSNQFLLSFRGRDVFDDLDLEQTPDFAALLGNGTAQLEYHRYEESCLVVAFNCADPQQNGERVFLDIDRIQVAQVPEPASLWLVSAALCGLAWRSRASAAARA